MEAANQAPAKPAGFFRTLWRLLRQLFHETTGTVFFLLALSWSAAALRNWRTGEPRWLLATCGIFAILMTVFGVMAFRSASRVR